MDPQEKSEHLTGPQILIRPQARANDMHLERTEEAAVEGAR